MNETVSLDEVLEARDERAQMQHILLSKYGKTMISFTLNIAGPVKVFPLAVKTFREGRKLILRQLSRHGVPVLFDEAVTPKTGYENYFIVKAEPRSVKRWMAEIEDDLPFGRLFDIDVLGPDGHKVSRSGMGLAPRKCLLCEENAPVCARSRRHSGEELKRETVRIMRGYFEDEFTRRVALWAARALIYEASVSPKPGLVDRFNSGSHSDMDIFTLEDSSLILAPYFAQFAKIGMNFEGTPPQLFDSIRYKGRQAEDAMFVITGGVNTHKGLVFSLGIICAAAGYLHESGKTLDSASLLDYSARMSVNLMEDFRGVTAENASTHGEKLYALYGIAGIRGEAAGGFPSVAKYSLPVLKSLRQKGFSFNDAGVVALLHLIGNVKDTNIISRSDLKTQELVQKKVKYLLEAEECSVEFLKESARQLDEFFIRHNISAGGCADLLAISFMLLFLETAEDSAL